MSDKSNGLSDRPRVSICVGTSCYVLGGAELLSDVETAIDSGRMQATLSGSTCMGHCNRVGASRVAPCATVDGVLIERASAEAISEVVSDRAVEEEEGTW